MSDKRTTLNMVCVGLAIVVAAEVIEATKTAKEGLAELPDHAVPPVLAGTAILEMALGNLGQAKGTVKLPVGEQSGV